MPHETTVVWMVYFVSVANSFTCAVVLGTLRDTVFAQPCTAPKRWKRKLSRRCAQSSASMCSLLAHDHENALCAFDHIESQRLHTATDAPVQSPLEILSKSQFCLPAESEEITQRMQRMGLENIRRNSLHERIFQPPCNGPIFSFG